MNSFYSKNLELFSNRFPQLAKSLIPQTGSNLEVFLSKNGSVNLLDNNFEPPVPLHSRYNPLNEAQNTVKAFDSGKNKAAVFYSFGLGWAVDEFCKTFPSSTLILIEQNPEYFFTALENYDWTNILNHQNLIILLGNCSQEASSILGRFEDNELCFFTNPNQCKHQESYIAEIKTLLNQQKQKKEINTNTLEKFSHLWMKNSCKNLKQLSELDGVNKYFNLAEEIPFVVLAAGPSLQSILPYAAEIKKRAVIVCVDTALHALLKTGVEPDFIVIVDPQYYCALHLEFLKSPQAVLIGESAVWPSVFRFECKEKVLCSSLFPIGQYFENKLGSKGKLGAGGSVSTTSWDFARKCRAKEIYIAGMDLGFPNLQTHIKGSQFEEKAHFTSSRFAGSEYSSAASLITANPEWKSDYNGKPLLTDKKMSLFSWWFEDAVSQAILEGTETFTLTSESLSIKGIKKCDLQSFLSKKECVNEKLSFFAKAEEASKQLKVQNTVSFEEVYDEFCDNLDYLKEQAKKGLNLCEKALLHPEKLQEINSSLSIIDQNIMNSKAKDAASLVFPTSRTLEKLSKDIPETRLKSIYFSKLIYSQLLTAIKDFQKNL